jgi:LPS sulfotransferase NodH
MAQPFILLATQRSGSSWVQEMLNSHPELKVYTEMFLIEARGTPMWEPNDYEFHGSYIESRARSPARSPRRLTRSYWTVRYLRGMFDQPEIAAVGFKYMYDQVRHSPEVLPYAAARRVQVVHLKRNLLDVLISTQLARASGVYHVTTDDRQPIPWVQGDPGEQRLRLDPAQTLVELRRLARDQHRARLWLRLTRTPTLEVDYGRLTANPSAFTPILQFLGVSDVSAELGSALKKIRSADRADVVANYDELAAGLSRSPFAALLREG